MNDFLNFFRIMRNQIDLLKKELKAKLIAKYDAMITKSRIWFFRNQGKILFSALFAMLLVSKDISFSVQMNSPTATAQPVVLKEPIEEDRTTGFWATVLRVVEAISPVKQESSEEVYVLTTPKKTQKKEESLSLFDVTEFTQKKFTPKQQEVRDRQEAYVKKHAEIAQAEMAKFKIPASITLAQGIVETNAGISGLATKNNNHFGIKCFSRKCKKGHCSNFSDDTHKDFFRKYKSTWESYRAHSKLLTNKRYQPLYKFEEKDYKNWAHGLKKAGYATDRRYAEKLIKIIEDLELYRYDSIGE